MFMASTSLRFDLSVIQDCQSSTLFFVYRPKLEKGDNKDILDEIRRFVCVSLENS